MDEHETAGANELQPIGEAFAPLARMGTEIAKALGTAINAWLEQNRPALDALWRLSQDPSVRAYIEARERGEIPPPVPPRPCHCLCGRAHKASPGICDGQAVTSRHYETRALGPVDVSLCAPCASAQGILVPECAE